MGSQLMEQYVFLVLFGLQSIYDRAFIFLSSKAATGFQSHTPPPVCLNRELDTVKCAPAQWHRLIGLHWAEATAPHPPYRHRARAENIYALGGFLATSLGCATQENSFRMPFIAGSLCRAFVTVSCLTCSW